LTAYDGSAILSRAVPTINRLSPYHPYIEQTGLDNSSPSSPDSSPGRTVPDPEWGEAQLKNYFYRKSRVLTILQRKSGQNRKREDCKWTDNNIGLVELIPAIDFTVCAVVVELPFSDYDETTQTHFSATLASTRKYTLGTTSSRSIWISPKSVPSAFFLWSWNGHTRHFGEYIRNYGNYAGCPRQEAEICRIPPGSKLRSMQDTPRLNYVTLPRFLNAPARLAFTSA
jgi:hypothetical protein